MAKISLLAGAAVGYVLGARAGRERYDQIEQKAKTVLDDPRVQKVTRRASEVADQAADDAAEKADQGMQQAAESSTSTRPGASRPGATVSDIGGTATEGGIRG